VARVSVKLSRILTSPEPEIEIACAGATVGEVIADAMDHDPSLARCAFRTDSIMAGVFLNGRNVYHLRGVQTTVLDGDRLLLIPPLAGG
jgi:molybdopterin converting factor small subunit